MPNLTAETVVRSLVGHRSGAQWMVRCPAHEDNTPSLSVRDTAGGRVLVHCHAGCSQSDVIAALVDRGLWPASTLQGLQPAVTRTIPIDRRRDADEEKRRDNALRLWLAAHPPECSPVEAYLSSRGICASIPPSLKYHPSLSHRSGGKWPAMVGLVTRGNDERAVGVHRTFLRPDGQGKAPVDQQKMMLGRCRGGAVRLAKPASPLMIAEGIETALSAMQATGFAAWAALSTSGIVALELPPGIRELIILADGDLPRAPQGQDFNDLLRPDCSICEALQS
jgi:putative DNA primase/helicase